MSEAFVSLVAELRESADSYDRDVRWPVEALRVAAHHGALKWCISGAFGGDGVAPETLLRGYESLGRGSLTIALILTQRDGACQLIEACENEELKRRTLPRYATGDALVTVGISQLTTSSGPGNTPHMTAKAVDGGYAINGRMPWVTAAGKCDEIVTGAVLADGTQLLAVVSREAPGLVVGPRMELLALEASYTTSVACESVFVPRDQLLRPVQREVLRQRAPTKSLTVAAVGIGFAGGLLDEIGALLPKGDREFATIVEGLENRFRELQTRIMGYASKLNDESVEVPKSEIRADVNDLINRAAIVCMTLAKGTGFLKSRRAQRLVREAMFFNVWSSPDDVRRRTLVNLMGAMD